MDSDEKSPRVPYPEYSDSGKRNPIHLPVDENSEQWEKDDLVDSEITWFADPFDHLTLADEPNE